MKVKPDHWFLIKSKFVFTHIMHEHQLEWMQIVQQEKITSFLLFLVAENIVKIVKYTADK